MHMCGKHTTWYVSFAAYDVASVGRLISCMGMLMQLVHRCTVAADAVALRSSMEHVNAAGWQLSISMSIARVLRYCLLLVSTFNCRQ